MDISCYKKSSFYLHYNYCVLLVYLGIWFGWGYCPLTDWQWHIKEQLGETNLPASFITWFANKIMGMHFSDRFINLLTLILFISATVASVYFNFIKPPKKNKKFISG